MDYFKILVILSGILFIAGLFNSLIHKYKSKWFPLQISLEELKKNKFKEIGKIIQPEGIISILIYLVLCFIYITFVNLYLL